MAEIPFTPGIVYAKVQWSEHHKNTHDWRPHVGLHVQLQAASQRPQPWPVAIRSISGTNSDEVSFQFLFLPGNPLPEGTPFELILINKRHHHVIGLGETLPTPGA